MDQEKDFETWLRGVTFDEAQGLFDRAARARLAELSAAADLRTLTEAEAEDLKRIKDHFDIKERRVVVKAVDAMREDVAPVPWDYWKRRRFLFPIKSSRKASLDWVALPSGERVVSTTADFGNKTVTHRGFIPAGVSEKDLPKFGELTEKIYRASIFFQKAQVRQTNSITWPHVTKADLLRVLGYNEDQTTRGGKILGLIDQAYMTLAYFTFEIKDKKSGLVEAVDHILSWRRDTEGHGFYFKLNDAHTRLILSLARGEKLGLAYAGIPIWLLHEDIPDAKRGIFEELISLGGLKRPYPVFIKTILVKWAGLKEAAVNNMYSGATLSEYLLPILDDAKDRGLIKDYAYDLKSTRDANPLNWKILFSFYYKKRQYAVDPNLLAAMMELWGQPSLFDNKSTAEKTTEKRRAQLTAVIKKHGPGTISRIFDETKNDSEAAFWRYLKVYEREGS
ncbi:MAG: hypothetical protein NTW38_10915 [Candidatus Aminicenantes bacterium]|nr:hypothetical protein [Candidatus Aminicenantes bacterium]